ncbi:MAG: hypothetical protein IPK50_08440 [Fibrobacterota bacterium]|nr:hypothetical protein [Fibrobacterota bacterium]QQS06911.1 MAG: hypothetical protein IPK50_08440 [Fibrobacterota bacterium]
MRRFTLSFFALMVAMATGCSRSPAESFGMIGFRGMRVVYVSDSADVTYRDEATRFESIPLLTRPESPEVAVRAEVGQRLYAWGANCGSKYVPKRGSWDPKMGLSKASDGWNVASPAFLRNYARTTNTDYIVVLNRVMVRRGDVTRSGEKVLGKLGFADITLDLSVIDAREGKRVWRSPAQGRAESLTELGSLTGKAIDISIDNFYAAIPQVHRWGCADMVDNFK